MMLNGIPIITSHHLTETKEVHRQPRKWARRVMYQRWREFDYTYAQVPSRQVIKFGDSLVMHPAIADELIKATEQ